MKPSRISITLASVLVGTGWIFPQAALSHCDTMDGPVVAAAQAALAKKHVTPVLMWVKKEDEAGIKAAFAKTLAARAAGAEARELADQFFFETLVRVHRAGEGAPFTGLKPAGGDVGPAVKEADKALETGAVEPAIHLITGEVATGIRQRHAAVLEKKKHADRSVEAGREFVAAYVDYVHYVEGLHEQAVQAAGAHHAESPAKEPHQSPPLQHHP